MGQALILFEESYNHLSIVIHRKLKLSQRIGRACQKGRKFFFALSDIVSHFLNPMTISHLYKTIVIQYFMGVNSEIITPVHTDKNFAFFNILIAKKNLNLPKLCRSDICESLFSCITHQRRNIFKKKKLLFLGRLCRMEINTLPKTIFLIQLFSYWQNLRGTIWFYCICY